MLRPRIALSLFLTAMAGLVMLDRLTPVEGSAARDYAEIAADPLSSAGAPCRCEAFTWFEQHQEQACAKAVSEPMVSATVSVMDDVFGVAAMLIEAHRVTALYRALTDNFTMTAEALDDDFGLMTDFSYGPVLAAPAPATQPVAAVNELALAWPDASVFGWIDMCDVAPGYGVVAGCEANDRSDSAEVGNLADLVACVRCSESDLAAEMNEPNQGLEPTRDVVEQIDAGPAYESLAIEAWPGLNDLPNALSARSWSEDAASKPAQAMTLQPGTPLETELFDALRDGLPPGGCPFLIEDGKQAAGGSAPAAGGPSVGSPTGAWGACVPKTERSDSTWYDACQRQARVGENETENEAAGDPRAAARFASALSTAAHQAATLLEGLSRQMREVTEQAMIEAARRESQSARLPKDRDRPDVKTSEIIYVEI
jgi:hypothetical protein